MYASQSFAKELNLFLNENIIIETLKGETIEGVIVAYDPETISVIIEEAVFNETAFDRMMVNGSSITKIYLKEKRFDLNKLKAEIEKSFPNLVEYRKELGIILVMNRIRVNETGVQGDPGPATDRVKKIFNAFLEQTERT